MSTHEVRENPVLMTDQERLQLTAKGMDSCDDTVPMNNLSKRELQVAFKIMEGHSNKVIATELFISERTVKFHCANIYKKLNISNRTVLIANCFRALYHPTVTQ